MPPPTATKITFNPISWNPFERLHTLFSVRSYKIAQYAADEGVIRMAKDTIVDFLKTHQEGFDAVPFSPVDSLVLSTLSYLEFDEYPYGDASAAERIPLIDLMRFIPQKRIIRLAWLKEDGLMPAFVEAVMRSHRYADATVRFFKKEDSPVIEKQFCACLFEFSNCAYVAYRGTDGTLTGWKEDFNLCFQDVIPSQLSATHFLNAAACEISSDAQLYIGGHSKGGNLAEYALACCNDWVYDRVVAAFDHDGPSFLSPPSPRFGTEGFRARMQKTVPASSIFGMIMEEGRAYRVVESNATGVFQHNPLSWCVKGTDFIYQEGLNQGSLVINETLDSWLSKCTIEQRALFINTIFGLLTSNDADSWGDIVADFRANAAAAIKDGSGIDASTRDALQKTMQSLGDAIGDVARKRMRSFAGNSKAALEAQAEERRNR